jgi:hypothetical protein
VVVRLPRAQAYDNTGDEEFVLGPVGLDTSLVDEVAGRLFLITRAGEMWGFDTATMSFVGVVAAAVQGAGNGDAAYGVDETSGRVFFLSPSYGLGVAEGRFFPIPQARVIPGTNSRAQERILSDTATGRVYVLPADSGGNPAPEYTIYQASPAPVPPAKPSPDRNTIDRTEQAGVTDSRFFGSGTGYGARVLLANGISTVAPVAGVGGQAPTAEAISKYVNSKCGFTDRELNAGRVGKAEYDTGSTAASAIAVGVDDRTQLDLARPSRCDFNVRDGKSEVFPGIFSLSPVLANQAGPGWNRQPATCTSSSGGEAQDGQGIDPAGQPAFGTSDVSCPLPGGTLKATAVSTLTGAVSVGKAITTTEIKREARGLVSRTVAVAQDIDIAFGAVHIDQVQSIAESVSNGRPHTGPMSSHDITIKGLSIAGNKLCTDCNTDTVVAVLNQAASGRAQFRSGGGIDQDLLAGSKGGALTAVQKSEQRQASDRALVGDTTNEVPGLEMIVYNDNYYWGRARQLYQFAGVATSATYNITMLPTGVGFTDDQAGSGETSGDATDTFAIDQGRTGAPGSISDPLAPLADPGSGPSQSLGSTPLTRALRSIARGIRLFFTSPRDAGLLMTAWGLLLSPLLLSRRRRFLAAARSV